MPKGLKIGDWSIQRKIIASQLFFVMGLLVVLLIIYSFTTQSESVEAYVDKARTLTLAAESARQEMEAKWDLGLFTLAQMRQMGQKGERDKLLATVPVVSAWKTAMMKAKEGHYEFRVPSFQPRNPANEPSEFDAKVLKSMTDNNQDEAVVIDSKKNEVRYYRAVRLSRTCLYCHGNPANSQELWGNSQGLDVLGSKMEGWKEGQIHGAFEVLQSLAPAEAKVHGNLAEAGLVSLALLAVGVFISFFIARSLSRPILAAARVIDRASTGDFTSYLDPAFLGRQDEIGQVMEDMEQMNHNISQTVRKVNQAAVAVAEAAQEIRQGNQELNDRTQQQASAIEETASALEADDQLGQAKRPQRQTSQRDGPPHLHHGPTGRPGGGAHHGGHAGRDGIQQEDQRDHQRGQRDRLPDQPLGPKRRRGGGPGGRGWPGLRRGGRRGAQPGRAFLPGRQGNPDASSPTAWPRWSRATSWWPRADGS